MSNNPWIQALIKINESVCSEVRCPNCKMDNLIVEDLTSELDARVIERRLTCPSCKASVSARIATSQNKVSDAPSDALDFAERAYNRFFKKQ